MGSLLYMSLYHDSVADLLYIANKATKALETLGIPSNWMQNTDLKWMSVLTGYFKIMKDDFWPAVNEAKSLCILSLKWEV